MRIGRAVYVATDKGILMGVASELKADGLNFKTTENSEPQFAPKGEAHKVRGDFASKVKEAIGLERPTLREGDAVVVVLKDGTVQAGQVAASAKDDKVKVVLTKGGKPKAFPVESVHSAESGYTVESLLQKLTGVNFSTGYSVAEINPSDEEMAQFSDEETDSDNDSEDEGDED